MSTKKSDLKAEIEQLRDEITELHDLLLSHLCTPHSYIYPQPPTTTWPTLPWTITS